MKNLKKFQDQQELSASTMSKIYGGRVVKTQSGDGRIIDKAWYRKGEKVPYKTQTVIN